MPNYARSNRWLSILWSNGKLRYIDKQELTQKYSSYIHIISYITTFQSHSQQSVDKLADKFCGK